ncbi:siderophore-interacting protein [Arcobacter sp. CECT 8983]|uniref:FecR family protein n=1 Tax=Arcobacter sp. CECT 8983 TaxID=2044508 RepID=UPI00100BAB41|nr:FecR domain-containing protein [Arcobacter sp. CECT 8983]RXJ91793.1 siderophore-interacting protein [Arcobacter sp. CECT 8983]
MDLLEEIDKKAISWIIKEQEGLSLKEKNDLKKWLENINHANSYNENKKLFFDCKNLDEEFLNECLDNTHNSNIFYKSKYLVASIIALLFVCAFLLEQNKNKILFSKEFSSKNEKILNIALEDSSLIDLDIKSKMKVEYYKNKRVVNFHEGKAFFSVAKDKNRPFFIKMKNAQIEVLGTKFEVSNLNDKVSINVLSGIVKVSHISDSKKKKDLIQLKKSESFSLDNKGNILDFKKTNLSQIASWKNDLIYFENHTLKDAVSFFQRYINKKVEFDSYELSQQKISGKFSTKNFDGFIDSIKLLYSLKIEEKEKILKISKK